MHVNFVRPPAFVLKKGGPTEILSYHLSPKLYFPMHSQCQGTSTARHNPLAATNQLCNRRGRKGYQVPSYQSFVPGHVINQTQLTPHHLSMSRLITERHVFARGNVVNGPTLREIPACNACRNRRLLVTAQF